MICYSCHHNQDEKLTTSNTVEVKNNLTEALEFGENMLNELLSPPWTSSAGEEKKFSSLASALAFIQVSEMMAGKLLSLLPPGENATLNIDNVSTILLQTILSPHSSR